MSISIDNVTLCATNMNEMVVFYSAVLDAKLEQFEPFPNFISFRGKLGILDFQIVSNEIAQVQASQNRQQFQFIVDDVTMTIETALANGGTLIDEALLEELMVELRQLPTDAMEVLELRFFEEKNFKEISYILDITESGAKMRLYRAVEKLKKRFNITLDD